MALRLFSLVVILVTIVSAIPLDSNPAPPSHGIGAVPGMKSLGMRSIRSPSSHNNGRSRSWSKPSRYSRYIKPEDSKITYFYPCKVRSKVIQPQYATSYTSKEVVQVLQIDPVFVQNIQEDTCVSAPTGDNVYQVFNCRQRYSTVEVYTVGTSSSSQDNDTYVAGYKPPVNFQRELVIVEAGCDFYIGFRSNAYDEEESANEDENSGYILSSPYNSDYQPQTRAVHPYSVGGGRNPHYVSPSYSGNAAGGSGSPSKSVYGQTPSYQKYPHNEGYQNSEPAFYDPNYGLVRDTSYSNPEYPSSGSSPTGTRTGPSGYNTYPPTGSGDAQQDQYAKPEPPILEPYPVGSTGSTGPTTGSIGPGYPTGPSGHTTGSGTSNIQPEYVPNVDAQPEHHISAPAPATYPHEKPHSVGQHGYDQHSLPDTKPERVGMPVLIHPSAYDPITGKSDPKYKDNN